MATLPISRFSCWVSQSCHPYKKNSLNPVFVTVTVLITLIVKSLWSLALESEIPRSCTLHSNQTKHTWGIPCLKYYHASLPIVRRHYSTKLFQECWRPLNSLINLFLTCWFGMASWFLSLDIQILVLLNYIFQLTPRISQKSYAS